MPVLDVFAGILQACSITTHLSAGTVNDMLWLPGDGHSQLLIATEAGSLRRIPLDPAATASTVLSHVATPLHGVLSLAYSSALKLVGYTTAAGDAALLACIARLPVQHLSSRKATAWWHHVPRAMLVSVRCKQAAGDPEPSRKRRRHAAKERPPLSVSWGLEGRTCHELFESVRGASCFAHVHSRLAITQSLIRGRPQHPPCLVAPCVWNECSCL